MKQTGVCTSTLVVSPDPLSPLTSTALKLQKAQKRILVMTLNQQMKETSK
jgi:hypothetical protein